MKTHSDENFQVLECRNVRKQRKSGNNATVCQVPSDPSPRGHSNGPRLTERPAQERSRRVPVNCLSLLWLVLCAKSRQERRRPSKALPDCCSVLNFSWTTSEPWENSVSIVVSKWELIKVRKGGRNDNRVHLLKCNERSLPCSLFIYIYLFTWLRWVWVGPDRIFLAARRLSSCIVQAQ